MGLIKWLRERTGALESSASIAQTHELTVTAEARGLAQAGNFREAIALLTAANQSNRQRDIDRLLLELRSEGFLSGQRQKESPQWPEEVPDQFGGEGIPEINGDQLSAEAIRSGLRNHGSLIIRQLITPDQVDLLRNNIDRVLRAFDAVEAESVGPELEGWFEPFHRDTITDRARNRLKGSMLTVDSPPALFDLLEIFESCGLSAVIRDYFGEPPALLSRKGTLRRVRHDVRTGGWHQDGGFLGEDIRALNVWLALTDSGVDAPGMDIVAKRLPGIVQTGSDFAEWATNPQAAKEVSEGCTVRPVFAPGDAIIFDHICLHRTAADPGMTKTRYAIETWLMAPSTYKESGVPILF
tara:strand:- start:11397 stop:12458 length:1062 start_codon:yes stop_codon:yes gene_type:complete